MKKYIEGETKAERKVRKTAEKGCRPLDKSITPVPRQSLHGSPLVYFSTTQFVCCLKYGTKYSADYVNNLYNMVSRNLTVEHQFVCFTEDASGIDERIRVEPIPIMSGVTGWWYKPLFFNPKLALQGTLLFLDLDMIIFKNIDYLFTYEPTKFCIIRDFNRHVIKNYNKFNSSVFRLTTGMHSQVYNNFITNPRSAMTRYHGDQDLIRASVNDGEYAYWPEEWIQSYKWEMRGKPAFDKGPRGNRDFGVNGDPIILNETSVAVFHGDPNPHNCKDQWVIDNWS